MTHPISEKKLDVAVEAVRDEMARQGTNQYWGAAQGWDYASIAQQANAALTKKVDELEAAVREADRLVTKYAEFFCEEDFDPLVDLLRTALNDTTQCRESDNG